MNSIYFQVRTSGSFIDFRRSHNCVRHTKLEHPVAHINAFHSSGLAKKVFSDDMSGLEPVVFLEKCARVMLTMNLLSTAYWDLGTVVDNIFQNNY